MSTIDLDEIYHIICDSISVKPARESFNEEVVLSHLGIDSLAVLNTLVSAADKFNLDLSALAEDMEPPQTVGDVMKIIENIKN